MDITNIKPASALIEKKERPAPKLPPRKDYGELDGRAIYYRAPTTNEADFISKPVALAVRQFLDVENFSYRKAASYLGMPHATLSRWIAAKRVDDCPNYILHKLKEVLK